MPAMLKCQLLNDNNSKKRVSKIYKRLRIYENDNKKQDLNEYKGRVDRYIPFLSILPFFSFQKESNLLSNLEEETKSLMHFVCIL